MNEPIARTDLLCKDCRWATVCTRANPLDAKAMHTGYYCQHTQSLWQEPVLGQVEQMTCRDMRLSGPCGYGGALWEQAPGHGFSSK